MALLQNRTLLHNGDTFPQLEIAAVGAARSHCLETSLVPLVSF